jgi:hypothetical protein
MKQPFNPKYIRRYLLLYGGVVVAVVLFYFLNSSSNPTQSFTKKEFSTSAPQAAEQPTIEPTQSQHTFRLLEKRY